MTAASVAAQPDPRSPSAMVVDWELPSGVSETGAGMPLTLDVKNQTSQALTGHITLNLRGLGSKRTVDLGSISVAANSTRQVSWVPSSSPIRPTRTSVRIVPHVAFTQGDSSPNLPGSVLAVAFSADGSNAFASLDDDSGVRLASLGLRKGGPARTLSSSETGAILAEVGSRHGWLDDSAVDQLPAEAAAAQAASTTSKGAASSAASLTSNQVVTDSIVIPETGAVSSTATAAPQITPIGYCTIANRVTGAICADYQLDTFEDLGIASSTVPIEDYNPQGASASYLNATVTSSGLNVWSGRLDANGCTPSITYCRYSTSVSASTSSIQKPNQTVGSTFIFGSREFTITPGQSYAASLRYGSTGGGAPLAWADLSEVPQATDNQLGVSHGEVQSDDVLRVAAIISRILTMPDNGVLLSTAASYPVHVENGCPDYPSFQYGTDGSGNPLYGEACGGAAYAWFGPGLSYATGSPVPTGHHTTRSAVTVAHELGHGVQFSNSGGPTDTNYNDIGSGVCSCDFVNVGNRIHCLQSRHDLATSEVEGFAQLYATRVLNNQKTTPARFVYYKNFEQFIGGPYNQFQTLSPPVPINASAAFQNNGHNGWVRSWCDQSSHASEYDWLTFYWGNNGSPTGTSRLSLADLFAVTGNSSVAPASNFTWTNLKTRAQTYFGGTGSPKFSTFDHQGLANGIADTGTTL